MSLTRARFILASALIGAGVSLVTAQQPAPSPNFIGTVTAMDAKDITGGRRNFEAGARTAWHSHDRGQLIYAESGRMRTGRRGEAFKEYPQGGTEYTAPNVEHWHGATPSEPLVQVNIQFGGTTKWLEATTDAQYNARK
jgi:quercetin dioxygenase-like cupin family protein